MIEAHTPFSRRRLLKTTGLSIGALAFTKAGAFAEELARTPRQAEGPFYPINLPLDTDNDLLILNDQITPAVGEITHLTGRILSPTGEPIRNATVEIWQVDHNGAYLHPGSARHDERDSNFQGFGRFLTNTKGEYYFRTIKPVPYDNRTPHIHFAIDSAGQRALTTQLYIEGETLNSRDFLYNRLSPEEQRIVTVPFAPLEKSKHGELAAHFDIVLGQTPEETDAHE